MNLPGHTQRPQINQVGYHQCYLPRGKDSAGNFHDADGMVRSLTLGFLCDSRSDLSYL